MTEGFEVVGSREGWAVGFEEGSEEGCKVGLTLGYIVGSTLGLKLGHVVGSLVGFILGSDVGLSVDGPFKLQYPTTPFKLSATELHTESLLDSVIPSIDKTILNSSVGACDGPTVG